MARYQVTLTTASPTAYLCDVVRRHDSEAWVGTAYSYGTFGGGTVAIQGSPDGGVTKCTLKQEGTNVDATKTADGTVNVIHGGDANKNADYPKIYATLTGSTGATVTVVLYDNR
jgi:hypothetical protein